MKKKRWEHFPHQADIGVRGIGATREEAFEQAALAMTAVVADLRSIKALEPFEVECPGAEGDQLLLDWLNRIVYEMSARRMLFSRFDVAIVPAGLRARIWGERVNARKHKPAVEVKAATYHGLKVQQTPEGLWIAECVVDV